MSLVNDMLRNLDARRVTPNDGKLSALPIAGTTGMRSGSSRAFSIMIVLTATVFSAPFITHYLEVFDWGRPGGHVTTGKIPVPAMVEKQRVRHTTVTVTGPTGMLASNAADSNDPAPVTGAVDVDTDIPAATPGAESTAHDDGNIHPVLSRDHYIENDFRSAATAAAAGDVDGAIHQLERLLGRDGSLHRARLLLARLHIQQQDSAFAESLLQDGLVRYPLHVPYARLLAHLLIAAERHHEAINHLQTALPGASRDADYHALLAGLYQQNNEPSAAIHHYTRALSLSPDHGEWWVGLGISQEQAGNSAAARSAYNRAGRYPLASLLQDYINKRLLQLPNDISDGPADVNTIGKV